MVVDVPGSAIVLALTNLVRDKNKVLLSTVSGSPKITGSECSPNTIGWTISNWALANGVVKTAVKNGGDSWFFLTSDWEYGHTLQAEASKVVESAGGKVLGAVRHPVGATEFSSYLLQAQSSRAKVIGLANSGSETTNSIKQASEFGVAQGGQKLASLYFQITDADSLGLQNAQQLQFVTAFYWDREESGRAFAKRFMARMNGQAPADTQAGVYSSTLSYLRSASQLGSAKDGKRVVDHMRSWNWFEAPLFGKTRIRKDGTAEHVLFLAETKSPKESTGRWDYLKILSTIPAEDAFQPESETGCPLSKN
jgi:branched-chain amino acid transport system substrate-binding protein